MTYTEMKQKIKSLTNLGPTEQTHQIQLILDTLMWKVYTAEAIRSER